MPPRKPSHNPTCPVTRALLCPWQRSEAAPRAGRLSAVAVNPHQTQNQEALQLQASELQHF